MLALIGRGYYDAAYDEGMFFSAFFTIYIEYSIMILALVSGRVNYGWSDPP